MTDSLVEAALAVRTKAYAPYSKYRVGAAIETDTGERFQGCNVENASYGLTACAESTALWKAVSEGERDIVAVAVAAGSGREAAPCGRCRQVLLELAPRAWVCWRDARGRVIRRRVRALLPRPFGPR